MGIKDWFGRGPQDYNEQLIQDAEAQRKATQATPAKSAESGWSGGDSGGAAAPPPPPVIDAGVAALLAQRKKIEAIKLYREIHGVGLKEAKDAIDAIVAGGAVAGGTTTLVAPVAGGTAAPLAPPGTDAEVMALLAQKRKIEAIKLYREIHDVGLKEAKDAVDAMDHRS